MRVLHLVHVRWWNASAQYAVHLAAAQKQAGHEVAVFTAAGEPPARHAKALGLAVRERGLTLGHGLEVAAELRRMSRGFDVINAHHADLQNIALLAVRGRGRPAIVRTRVDVRDAKRSAVARWLYNHKVDAVIVPGDASRTRYVERLGITPGKVHTVYGGVDHERFRPRSELRKRVRSEFGLPLDAVVFGLVGRLGAVKGPEVFIEAAAQVHARNPKALFVLAGRAASGHTEAEYKAAAERFGAAGVRFLGFVSDAARLMAALDVGVIASVGSEAHCRVGLEMMSAGLPVIGTDVGVIPEVVMDGETGYIVRSRDVPQLASVMERLVSDGVLRTRLGDQARNRVEERYTFTAWVRNTANVYRIAQQQAPDGPETGRNTSDEVR